MATVHSLRSVEHAEPDTVFGRLADLGRLEIELGLAETRDVVRAAVIAIGVAVVAAIALIASGVVLIAGAVAPLFDAPWMHLVTGAGAVFVIAALALTWSASRLKHLEWPEQT